MLDAVTHSRHGRFLLIAATALAVSLAISGCARQRADVTGTIRPPDDYRERHPIILANAPRMIEIYPLRGVGGLDARQTEDVAAFAAEYRVQGSGPLTIALPDRRGAGSEAVLADTRRALAKAGLPARYAAVTSYRPSDPAAFAPIRLSFSKFQAKVDSQCGQWQTDFNGAATSETFRNQSPPNFGCAYQSAIAAQVANPIDLARPRQEGPIDVLKRSKDIEDLRQHKDPSTEWKINAQQVGTTN